MSQITNLAYFYERSRKVRGGRILNPNKGFGHLWAAQLVQYTPAEGCLIFRSFEVSDAALASATTIKIKGDGFSDAPEVGMYIMIAPDNVATAGNYAKITAVEYDAENAKFKERFL